MPGVVLLGFHCVQAGSVHLALSFLAVFVFERPSLDGDIPSFQEFSEVLPVNTVMAAGQTESFESAAFYPFEYRAFTHLAVRRDVS